MENGAHFEMQNNHGNTVLHLAAREGNVLIVHFLIGKGANIEATESHGNTPLQLASRDQCYKTFYGCDL